MTFSRSRLRYAAAGVVALCALAFLVFRGPGSPKPPALPPDPPAEAEPPSVGDVGLAELESGLRAIEEYARSAPRDDWDPEYVAARLDRDAGRIADWVRDSTTWIPYRGVLRGPIGVLMDRQGNSLDRALLLATLLERADRPVRLAHGRLTHRQAGELLAELAAGHPRLPAQEPGARSGPHVLPAGFPRLGAGEQALASAAAELSARVDDQAGRLLRALGPRDPGAERARRVGRALDDLRDHWWVQIREGETWRDLDVHVPPGGAEATVALADVPRDAPYHEIVVRVVAERWAAGAVSERVAMEYALRPADLIGKAIVLQFWPTAWVEAGQPAAGPDPRERLLAPEEWSAMLLVGGDVVAGSLLDASGDDPDAEQGGAMGGLGRGIASAFGQQEPAGNASALSAVWLEYEIRVPGDSSRRLRRTVFDLLGPATRAAASPPLRLDDAARLTRSLALTMRTELLPLPCRPSPAFVSHLLAESLRGNRELLARQAGATREASLDAAAPTVSSLYALAVARFQWSRHGDALYIDRPGLLTSHLYPSAGGAGLALQEATDIVANEVGVSLMVPDAVAVRVAQGVLDTNAEALLLQGSEVLGNTGDAFALSTEWITLRPGDVAAADRLALPADVRRRIAEEVHSARLVVAPGTPVPTRPEPFAGWWRIDPESGHTLGYGANGWGQAVERAAQHSRSRLAMATLKRAGKRFAAVFATTYGWCLLQIGVQRGEAAGLTGIKSAVVSSPSECTGDAVFLGALAAFPLVALTVNMRFGGSPAPGGMPAPPEPALGASPAPEGAPPAPGQSPLAQSGAPPAPGQSPFAQSGAPPAPPEPAPSGPGKSPMAQSAAPPGEPAGPGEGAPPAEPPPPAPRSLPEIEADFNAAQGDLKAAQERFNPMQDAYEAELAKAQQAGQPDPPHPDGYREALINKIDQMHRIDFFKEEYVQAGGRLGKGGVPDGPMR